MKLEDALKQNPYDKIRGSKGAYITIAVITVPLGLMCLFSKKMLIVDNYYFEAEKGRTWE